MLDVAREEGTLVGVIAAQVMGTLRITTQFGPEGAVTAMGEARRRLERAVGTDADAIARIGEAEFAVLLVGVDGRAAVDAVAARIVAAFDDEAIEVKGEQIVTAMATGTKIGPSRRRGDGDLLWRAIEESRHARRGAPADAVRRARCVDQPRGGRADFADQGTALFGLEACESGWGDRAWSSPEVLPGRPPTGELPLRAEGRTIGRFRWWGGGDDEVDLDGVQVLLGHIAAALDRASLIDATENRARTDALTGLLNRDGLAIRMRDLRGS